MFEIDRFIEDCRAALPGGQVALREVMARAVSEPGQVLHAFGVPERAGVSVIHRSADLTVLNLVWGPYMTLPPHDHRMWAVIGLYTGREDNIFWRRLPDGHVEAAGAKALSTGQCATLGHDIVHSVTNPIPRLTCALHVYGGDFFAPGRTEWDAETLEPRPYDSDALRQRFEDSNALVGKVR